MGTLVSIHVEWGSELNRFEVSPTELVVIKRQSHGGVLRKKVEREEEEARVPLAEIEFFWRQVGSAYSACGFRRRGTQYMAMGVYDHDAAAAFANEIQSYGVRVTDTPAPQAAAAPVESPEAVVDEIRKLTDLLDHGHINQREYDTKKSELLARL